MAFANNNNHLKKRCKQTQPDLYHENKENFSANTEYQNETSAEEEKVVEENTDDNITDLNLNPVEEEDSSETTETSPNNDNIGELDEDSDTFDSSGSRTQAVIIDFTPTEEDNDDYRFEKVSSFWTFIRSRNDVKHMIVMPEIKEEEPPREKENSQENVNETQMETSAIEPFCICKDIFESIEPTIPSHTPARASDVSKKTDLDEATAVCKELEEWDRMHPTSKDPPETKLKMYGAVVNSGNT